MRAPGLIACAIAVSTPFALVAIGAARFGPSLIVAILAATAIIIVNGFSFVTQDSPSDEPPSVEANGAAPGLHLVEMFDAMPDPVLLIEGMDSDEANTRRFKFANTAARELLRLQRAEGPLTMALRSPEVLQAVDEALVGGIVGHAVYELGGLRPRFWRVRAAPLVQTAGRMVLLTLRDETELRRGERTRADFLANASHELRTPLASLAGFIETLRGHAKDDAEARERFLGIMHDQAERMRRLIDDLMSLSRIELGEHIPPSGRVDVSLAVMDVIAALTPIAAERNVVFRARLPAPGEAVVIGERDQIVQVIQNLIENALKYSPREGAVEVDVLAPQEFGAASGRAGNRPQFSLLTPEHPYGREYVSIRVRDAGPGIAREHLPRLTERFYRVEGQKSGDRSGTGLGLAIVKHILNRHHGGLNVESSQGGGSAFTVLLPRLEGVRAATSDRPSSIEAAANPQSSGA